MTLLFLINYLVELWLVPAFNSFIALLIDNKEHCHGKINQQRGGGGYLGNLPLQPAPQGCIT
jgi:hypothetical protein